MSIRDILQKINLPAGRQAYAQEVISFDSEGRVERLQWRQIYLSLVIILVGTLSFGLGRLTSPAGREPMEIRYDPELVSSLGAGNTATVLNSTSPTPSASKSSGEVVASSKGTKYHYSHCSGAKQISEKNKITFISSAAAEASGYTLAANCKPR